MASLLTKHLITSYCSTGGNIKNVKELFAVFRAVRDNGASAALLTALGLGHGRESAPVAFGLSALHPNHSDEPPAVPVRGADFLGRIRRRSEEESPQGLWEQGEI